MQALFGHAYSGVHNVNSQAAPGIGCPNSDTALVGEFDGIAQQVVEDLAMKGEALEVLEGSPAVS